MRQIIEDKMKFLYGAAIVAIFTLAFALRVVGASWGMPHNNLHPDEGFIFNNAYLCAKDHSFEVHEYYRPNHVTIKLNTILYVGIHELYFVPQGLTDFEQNYSEHFALFTTASRVLIALFGLGVVIFAYCIAQFFGKRIALFAALLFAVFPSFIEHSHYITPDIPLLFFFMGVLWSAFRYQKAPSTFWLFMMSLFTALATCEKYPGIYGCVIIAVTVCMTHRKHLLEVIKKGLLAILFVALGILAVSPILIIDFRTVLEAMAGQNKEYHPGADGLNFGQTLWFYLKTSGLHLQLILTATAIYGCIRTLKRNPEKGILLLSLWGYILPISVLSVHWERYTLPIYTIGLLYGAIGTIYLLDDLKLLLNERLKSIRVIGSLILLLVPFGSYFLGALAMTGNFLAPDSRILLQSTFQDTNITTSNTVYDCNTPLDPGGFYGAFGNFNGDPEEYKYGCTPPFLMTSSAQRDVYINSSKDIYQWIGDFYRKLDENYPLIYLFPVEVPNSYFLEVQNSWFAAKNIYHYLRGAARGYEIRVYRLHE